MNEKIFYATFQLTLLELAISIWLCYEVSDQCDQMARLFLQYLAIQNNENLPKSLKYLINQVHKFCQTLNGYSRWPKYFFKICLSDEISPNLVTLLATSTYIVSKLVQHFIKYKENGNIFLLCTIHGNSSISLLIADPGHFVEQVLGSGTGPSGTGPGGVQFQ